MTLIAELNEKVPRFSTKVGKFHLPFPNEKRVQEPLQEVYSLFIDSYLLIIDFLKERGDSESNPSYNPKSKARTDDCSI